MEERYTPEHCKSLLETLDPVEEINGYLVKRCDKLALGHVNGAKIRMFLHVISNRLDEIKTKYNGTLITGCGLPSPQGAMTAVLAKYFGLRCIVATPRYDNSRIDVDRIHTSLAQKYGAEIYGCSNPNPAGFACEVRHQRSISDAFEVQMKLVGSEIFPPIIYQAQNIPDHVEEVTISSASGLNGISLLCGLRAHKPNVKRVNFITVSNHVHKNMKKWYDPLPSEMKFEGEIHIEASKYSYRHKLKKHPPFDDTYEAKAWEWMIQNRPSDNHLFWVVAKKSADLSLVEPIEWKTSAYQKRIDDKKSKATFFDL